MMGGLLFYMSCPANLSFCFREDSPPDPLWITKQEMKKVKLLSQRLWESPDLSHESYYVQIFQIPNNGFNHSFDLNLAVPVLHDSMSSTEIVEINFIGSPLQILLLIILYSHFHLCELRLVLFLSFFQFHS